MHQCVDATMHSYNSMHHILCMTRLCIYAPDASILSCILRNYALSMHLMHPMHPCVLCNHVFTHFHALHAYMHYASCIQLMHSYASHASMCSMHFHGSDAVYTLCIHAFSLLCIHAIYACYASRATMHFMHFPCTLCIHASCNHASMHHTNICTMRLNIQTCMHFTQRCILCISCILASTHTHTFMHQMHALHIYAFHA